MGSHLLEAAPSIQDPVPAALLLSVNTTFNHITKVLSKHNIMSVGFLEYGIVCESGWVLIEQTMRLMPENTTATVTRTIQTSQV
jgi:Cu/Ag efflux pump CusA